MRTLLLVAALLGLVAVSAAQPAGDPVPKILEAWKKRQTAFKTVKYVVTGKVEVLFLEAASPDLQSRLPKTPTEYPYRSEVLLDIASGRFSHSSTQSVASIADQKFVEDSGLSRFDGKKLASGPTPGQSKPARMSDDVTVMTGKLNRSVYEIQLWPLFHAHGIIPSARRPITPERLKAGSSDESFVYRGSFALGDTACEVLRSEPLDAVPAVSDEVFVVGKWDAAILRHVYFAGKEPMARLDVAWKPHGSTWLPDKWTCTWTVGRKVQSKHHLQVERVELDVSVTDADFRYPIRPGMTVAEYDTPEPGSGLDPNRPSVRRYVATEGGGEVTQAETGKTTLAGEQLPPARSHGWIWWLVGGVGVGVVAAVLYRLKVKKSA